MVYLLLILFPMTIAASCFVVRRAPGLIIGAGVATMLTQMLLAAQIPLDSPVRLIGVTLNLSALGRLFMLAFIFVAALLLIAAFHLPHGENFVTITLITISQVCTIILLQDPFIVTLLLISTGVTAVLAIVDLPADAGTLVATQTIAAALKYLVSMLISGGLLYIAFVLADIFRPGELPGRISLARFVLALFAISFALRFALIPFHAWLTEIFQRGEPIVIGMVVILLNTTSLLVLILALQSFPALLTDNGGRLMIMRIGALTSALIGAALTINQPTMRRVLAYLLLADSAMIFYGLAAASELGLSGAIYAALNQCFALTLICISLAIVEQTQGRAQGLIRRDLLLRWPIGGVGLLIGGLTLLGLPPLSGFNGRLLLFEAAAAFSPWELAALVIATLLAAIGFGRMVFERLLGPNEDAVAQAPLLLGETELDRPAVRRTQREPRSAAALTLVLIGLSLGLGLYPEPLLALIDETVRGLAFIRAL